MKESNMILKSPELKADYKIELVLKRSKIIKNVNKDIQFINNVFNILFDDRLSNVVPDKVKGQTTYYYKIDAGKYINEYCHYYKTLIKKCVEVIDILNHNKGWTVEKFILVTTNKSGPSIDDIDMNYLYDNRYSYTDDIKDLKRQINNYWDFHSTKCKKEQPKYKKPEVVYGPDGRKTIIISKKKSQVNRGKR